MFVRTVALCFGFVVLTSAVASAQTKFPDYRPAWISFQRVPANPNEVQRIQARATRNVDADLLYTIVGMVDDATLPELEVVSCQDAGIKYGNRDFVVVRAIGKKLTVATGKSFPERSMRTVARRLKKLGYETEIVKPESLLLPVNTTSRLEPEFLVPRVDPTAY